DFCKKAFFAALLVFMLSCEKTGTSAAAVKGPKWLSFNQGYELALKEKKHLLVDFYADWCRWCKTMETQTFAKPAIISKLDADYIIARIHVDKPEKIQFKGMNMSSEEFAGGMGIEGLPTLMFFDKNGEALTKIPGFLDEKTMLPILDYISSECYNKQVSFDEYVKNNALCRADKQLKYAE
ncbi:MAG: thioredoxin fold domain-containing protein, partial [Leptospirales bacterium]|nr:thioredoxin fold domain-containing protein [Leptospirales bacterium]